MSDPHVQTFEEVRPDRQVVRDLRQAQVRRRQISRRENVERSRRTGKGARGEETVNSLK